MHCGTRETWDDGQVEPRILLFIIFGAAIAGILLFEKRLEGSWISIPMVYVGLGWLLFSLPLDLGWLAPAFDSEQTLAVEYITELIVIVSLVSLGLSIDRRFAWAGVRLVLPLLLVTMPLCIAAIALLGNWLMGLPLAGAILLGACLSPTDPVLARAVQVGPPGESDGDDVRFNLSAEAGFNDGLAFPFVYLAMAYAAGGDGDLWKWIGVDVVWKIAAGAGVGWCVGKAGAWFAFGRGRKPGKSRKDHDVEKGSEGLLVVAALMLAYGLGEIVNGYGFLSVFIAAVTAKQKERSSDLHKKTHGFVDQIETVILVVILIGFGGLLASGVLNSLTWQGALLGMLFLLVIRPLSGMLGMAGSGLPWKGGLAVAFLGVRGVGSFYYLSYGQHHAEFPQIPELWSVVSFTVLASIVIHGITAPRILSGIGRPNRVIKGDRAAVRND